jgi:hypothetical protein
MANTDKKTILDRFRTALDRKSREIETPVQETLTEPGTPPDVASPRAKSQRHGKVTADKWNQ